MVPEMCKVYVSMLYDVELFYDVELVIWPQKCAKYMSRSCVRLNWFYGPRNVQSICLDVV